MEMCWSMTVECGRAYGMMVCMVCMLALNMTLVTGIVVLGISFVYFSFDYLCMISLACLSRVIAHGTSTSTDRPRT